MSKVRVMTASDVCERVETQELFNMDYIKGVADEDSGDVQATPHTPAWLTFVHGTWTIVDGWYFVGKDICEEIWGPFATERAAVADALQCKCDVAESALEALESTEIWSLTHDNTDGDNAELRNILNREQPDVRAAWAMPVLLANVAGAKAEAITALGLWWVRISSAGAGDVYLAPCATKADAAVAGEDYITDNYPEDG